MAIQQARTLLPFRYATRQRIQPVPITSGGTFSENGTFTITLPRVGFLSKIYLRLAGTYNTDASVTPALHSPWDIVRNIRVNCNVGAATIYSTSGYSNWLLQTLNARGQGAVSDGSSLVYAFPTSASGTGLNFVATYVIPISANDNEQFNIGLINLQAPELTVTVEGIYNTVANGLGSGFSQFSASLSCAYEYYELPDPNVAEYPPIIFHRILEDTQQITAAGDQTITIPREGILYRIVHISEVNSTCVNPSRAQLRFNKVDTVYDVSRWVLDAKLQSLYSRTGGMGTGITIWELWGAEGDPARGDNRDMISSEALSTLESILTIDSSPAGSVNRIITLREFAQIASL